MSVNWLLMPVLMALVIKGTILLVAKRAAIKTDHLWAFIAAFAVHNLCELLAIFDAMDGSPNLYLYKVYYSEMSRADPHIFYKIYTRTF